MEQLTARQHWLSVLAHSDAGALNAHWQALDINPSFRLLRPTEIGLTRLQGKMGGTGKRFVLGDATVMRVKSPAAKWISLRGFAEIIDDFTGKF